MWNPYRSKLCAAIIKGVKNMHISEGDNVLYLGAATGTTASHVSDIIGKRGHLFGVEISERNMRELVGLCEHRNNMVPILADAEHPESYMKQIGKCDIIYQDISAKKQAEILLKNSPALKKGGYAYLVIKSQSIDISHEPEEIYREELSKIKGTFSIVEKMELEPYDSKHLFAVLRKLD
jgi:fibrillarin-like pre-rRNA processing protein